MSRFAGSVAASLLLVLWGVAPAHAFVLNLTSGGQPKRWYLQSPDPGVSTDSVNRQTGAIRFYIAADAFSPTNTMAEINAARSAFDVWESVPGSHLRFEFAGTRADITDVDTEDGRNTVHWAKGSTLVDNGNFDISGSLAFTFPTTLPGTDVLADSDIVLNGVDFNWITALNGTAGPNDWLVEAVVTHEVGHLLGLNHSPAGGATLYVRTRPGAASNQIGLASDDIAAAHFLYPDNGQSETLGSIQGQVTYNGSEEVVFGAIVYVEDAFGNVVSATVSEAGGGYALPALAPGSYTLRSIPLDPNNTSFALVNGPSIGPRFTSASPEFFATSPASITVTADQALTHNIGVIGDGEGFHISHIQGPDGQTFPAPASVNRGDTGVTLGVASPFGLPEDSTFSFSGSGVSLSNFTIESIQGFNIVKATADIAPDATPGLRTVILDNHSAPGIGEVYACGFLEILPDTTDDNFDGLDDAFQRQHFARWTSAEAAPDADPDQDRFPNASEAAASTDPMDNTSFLNIESITLNESGTAVRWQSIPGKQYQVHRKPRLDGASWETVGVPVTASATSTSLLDETASNETNFYRVEVLH